MSFSRSSKNTPKRTPNLPLSSYNTDRQNNQNIYKLSRSLFLKSEGQYKNRNKGQFSSIKQKFQARCYNKRFQQFYQQDNTCNNTIAQERQVNEQVLEVINQLAISYLFKVCQNFQLAIKQEIDRILNKFLNLEYKIAQVQKKFNYIQIFLHKRSKQIKTVIDQNQILIELNKDIQVRIQQLKQKYQLSFSNLKNEWISNKIEDFRKQLSEMTIIKKQCQSCRNGVKQKLRKQLLKIQNYLGNQKIQKVNQQKVQSQINQQEGKLFDKINVKDSTQLTMHKSCLNIIKQTLKQIIEIVYQVQSLESMGLDSWKYKILQNIDLKFQILNFIGQKKIQNILSRQVRKTNQK